MSLAAFLLRPSWILAGFLAGFSMITVYVTYGSIHVRDVQSGAVYAEDSLEHYHQALNGERAFPYQWRLLGVYVVRAGERLTGANPHLIDVTVKTVLLWISSWLLFTFSRIYTSYAGALCATALYFLLTTAGFTDGYSIYYTNDYAIHAAWFAAVLLVRRRRFAAAALVTFIGAWSKETLMLVPILLGFEWLRGRAPFAPMVWAGLAFLVPTIVLRTIYPAPIERWAWWDMAFANVPFLQSSWYEFQLTIKNNIKVLLFFNVLWVLAAVAAWRSTDGFTKSLALTLVVYVLLAYPVIYIRELRHFLPMAILILPLAIAEMERRQAPADRPA